MGALEAFFASAPRDWDLEILRKSVRHIYFRVDPEKKQVKVTAPRRISPGELEMAIRSKTPWMLKKITALRSIPPVGATDVKGQIMVRGRWHPLIFQEGGCPAGAAFDPEKGVVVHTRPGTGREKRPGLVSSWLRQCLKQDISALLEKWEPAMGVAAAEFGVKRMKTRWGSCNTWAKRIWINFALIRLDPALLEYVLVHELVHLLEPSHNRRFYSLMDQYLPQWKNRKVELDRYNPRNMLAGPEVS